MAISELLTRKKEDDGENDVILFELRRTNALLENAYERFELLEQNDLIEATIYEIESLKARYRYLLGIAKTKNLKASEEIYHGF